MEILSNLPPFYIGQKVIATSSTFLLVKGEIYTVLDIVKSHCGYAINVGLTYNYKVISHKCICGVSYKGAAVGTNKNYSNASRFAPLQENIFPSLTMKKVIKKEAPLVCMN